MGCDMGGGGGRVGWRVGIRLSVVRHSILPRFRNGIVYFAVAASDGVWGQGRGCSGSRYAASSRPDILMARCLRSFYRVGRVGSQESHYRPSEALTLLVGLFSKASCTGFSISEEVMSRSDSRAAVFARLERVSLTPRAAPVTYPDSVGFRDVVHLSSSWSWVMVVAMYPCQAAQPQ